MQAVFKNPFREAGNWYKANFHTHTIASDGKVPIELRVQQYRQMGYSVLAITDHNIVSSAVNLSTEDFLVLDGAEFSVPGYEEGRFYHLVCLNTPPRFSVEGCADPNEIISRAAQAGAVTYIAHPYWSGNNPCDLARLTGHVGVEIFNSSCIGMGKPNSSVHWDGLLEMGLQCPALAADDTHSGPEGDFDLGAGYVMLKMPELSAAAVLEALRSGCHYSSCGPQVLDFKVESDTAYVRCTEAKEIYLMGWRSFGHSARAAEGAVVCELQAQVSHKWKYVRAEIVDAQGRRAWTNPIFLSPT